MKKSLGMRIRELREERLDLSLREFAKRVGKTAAFLSDIELGRRHPSDEVLGRIAEILGEPLKELREYDTRAPVDALKRRAESDPVLGMALRSVVDKGISGEELLELTRKVKKKGEE